MGKIIFITGGARSGKSRFAERLLEGSDNVLYIATAIPFDEEMRNRIEEHRSRRNKNWETVEEYKELDRIISSKMDGKTHILLDCITIMVSNFLILDNNLDWDEPELRRVNEIEDAITDETERITKIAGSFSGGSIIVSNELGMGLVPPTPLGRYFRDIAGRINQKFAEAADEVYFLVSGVPVRIKG